MSQFQDQIAALEATINIANMGLNQAKMKLRMLKSAQRPRFNETPLGKKVFQAAQQVMKPMMEASALITMALEDPVEFRIQQWLNHMDSVCLKAQDMTCIKSKFYHKYMMLSMGKLLVEGQYLQSLQPENVTVNCCMEGLVDEIKHVATLPAYVKPIKQEVAKTVSEPVPA